jgi:protoheme IX farnesyltransferase
LETESKITIESEVSNVKNISKTASLTELLKLRLSWLVVFSALISYFTVADSFNLVSILMLVIGGTFVTGSANGFNQVIERKHDKLMKRTMNRPMPTSRLNVNESLIFCFTLQIIGVVLLWVFNNPLSGILGLLSTILYALFYTPLKRVTPLSVFVGAIPGAMPPLIGAVAATNGFGQITYEGWLLFAIQFIWQFPHFWAIAWMSHDDYLKAGFFMLPSYSGRTKASAFQILVYSLFLIPVSILPCIFLFNSWITGSLILLIGILFFILSIKLFKDCSIESAKKLMFASFIYLPIIQILILTGKWIQKL